MSKGELMNIVEEEIQQFKMTRTDHLVFKSPRSKVTTAIDEVNLDYLKLEGEGETIIIETKYPEDAPETERGKDIAIILE